MPCGSITPRACQQPEGAFVERDGRSLHQALIAAYGPDVGAEVTAEALAYGWEHWERLRVLHNPAGYLYRVGQSRAKRGVFRKPPPTERPIQPDGTHWFEPELPAAMSTLSDKQRAAVILVHGCGWSMTEVAETWGVGLSSVQTHMNRAMRKLRKALGVDSE